MSTETDYADSSAEYREVGQQDYFGFVKEYEHTLPDGISIINYRAMNEGAKKKYQSEVQKPLRINTRTNEAQASVDPAADRHALIRHSLTGWNLKRGNQPVPFTERNLKDFLDLADPSIIDGIEKSIRKANKWLLADLTVEQIDEQIEELQELRVDVEARESGEGASASK